MIYRRLTRLAQILLALQVMLIVRIILREERSIRAERRVAEERRIVTALRLQQEVDRIEDRIRSRGQTIVTESLAPVDINMKIQALTEQMQRRDWL